MKTNHIIQLLLLILISACQPSQNKVDPIGDPFESEQQAIKALLVEIFDAAKARDMAALDAFHLNSSKFSKFGGDIPGRQDHAAMTKFEREGFTQVSEFNYDLQNTKVDVYDDAAIATFIIDYNVKVEDTVIFKKKRFSMVFVKDLEQWKITHEHSSPYL